LLKLGLEKSKEGGVIEKLRKENLGEE